MVESGRREPQDRISRNPWANGIIEEIEE
jgi:hypothetical protein